MGSEEVIIDSPNGRLEGNLHLPKRETDKVIIMCHGRTSNKDRERLLKNVKSYVNAGFAVLRFNFGGSGNSYDTEIDVDKQVQDLRSVIGFVKSKDYARVGLHGSSLGGLVSLKAYEDIVRCVVLWAPVTNFRNINGDFEMQQNSQELEEKGYIVINKEGKEFKLGKNYFEQRASIDQKDLLSRVKCPVLIIHGDADDTVPLSDSQRAMDYLSKDSKLEVIGGLGHGSSFSEFPVVFQLSVDWFEGHL